MKVTLISDIYKFHKMRGRAGEVGLQVSLNFTNDLKPVEGLSGRRSSRPPLSPTSAFEAQLQNMEPFGEDSFSIVFQSFKKNGRCQG